MNRSVSMWRFGGRQRRRRLAVIAIGTLLTLAVPVVAQDSVARATFAGGCFWCMEKPFDELDGVLSTTSGFSGGHVVNPSYDQVSHGNTGHIEVVQVEYDPRRVSYEELLYVYWRNVDPFDAGGQFCDRGHTYTTAIFVRNREERRVAEASRREVARRFGRSIATDIREFEAFYPAEAYHQDYYLRNPVRYRFYRGSCGRDARLDEIWGDEARGCMDHE